MALDIARKYLEAALQKEMCKRFSSRFDNVNTNELSPFIAVLRMIKIEYARTKPEIFKTLVAILHDFNPAAGAQHRKKTCKYIRTLLMNHPDMADYLISVLPPSPNMGSSSHALHTTPTSNTSMEPHTDNQRPPVQPESERPKKDPVKYFNFTPPSVSAYVASQGVPQRIISGSTISTAATATKTTSLPISTSSAVHRYVIVNEPGGNLKRADDDNRPTTTIIQIPHGTANTLSSSKILECISAAKRDANNAVTMVTEGKDAGKTTFKVNKSKRVNRLVSDSEEFQMTNHFIQDSSGKLKLNSKGRMPAKLQKAVDQIRENNINKAVKRTGECKTEASLARKKTKMSDTAHNAKITNKTIKEKTSLDRTHVTRAYQTSHSTRTFPYMQTVVLSNNSSTETPTKVITKFDSDAAKIPPLLHLQKMVENSGWQKSVAPVTLRDPAVVTREDLSAYTSPPLVSYLNVASSAGAAATQVHNTSDSVCTSVTEASSQIDNPQTVIKFPTGDDLLLSSSCNIPEKPSIATSVQFYLAPETTDNDSTAPSNANTTTESEAILDCESVSTSEDGSSSTGSEQDTPDKLKAKLKVVLSSKLRTKSFVE